MLNNDGIKVFICEGCGNKIRAFLFQDNCSACIALAENGICPRCKSRNSVEPLIDYMYGDKIGAGLSCKICGWSWVV